MKRDVNGPASLFVGIIFLIKLLDVQRGKPFIMAGRLLLVLFTPVMPAPRARPIPYPVQKHAQDMGNGWMPCNAVAHAP
ncbi:hypothetical protein [Komagataeibacter sp. SM21]|uniref:hypothetical protein n=1 Tax=Komagataeibacter sp. SM21 TaxID=3242899 RepID=UPI0035272B55